jgi:N-acyl-D-aspartate/D-glutamate deacylase
MLDCVIRGARVVDGTGAAVFAAAVGLRDHRTAVVGDVDEPARAVVDGAGRVLRHQG